MEGPHVVAVDLHRVQMPLRHAHRAAHGTEVVRDLVLVAVRFEDDVIGWGECSALARPTYTAEHTAGAWALLRDELGPAVLEGRSFDVVGHPMATAGLVTALTDAVLRRVERPLATELAEVAGGNPLGAVAITAVVGRADHHDGTIDDVVAAVDERVQERVALVKLKVTPDEDDLAAVAAVRQAWPDLELAVDFNGTADADSLRRVDGLHLAYIEQPAPADALVASAHLAAQVEAPIALDESVTSLGALDAAVALAAGSIINVKPARCGGPHAAGTLVAHARNAGLDVFVGGMLESGIGRAAALAVAALPGCTLPTDLGPSHAYFEPDVTEPFVVDVTGRLPVPLEAGIGRAPILERLAAVTVDHIQLTR